MAFVFEGPDRWTDCDASGCRTPRSVDGAAAARIIVLHRAAQAEARMRSTGRVATLVAALALACGSRCDCNPNPSALAQSDLPLGAACLATSECATGLECRFYDPDRNGECYKGCAGDPAGCPAGSSCDPVHGRCETSCLGDWYCSPEAIALKCQGWNAQEGCWANHCSCGYLICNGDGECPKGSRCVEGEDFGDLAYGVDCIPGFCQLRP